MPPVHEYAADLRGTARGRVLLCYITEPFHTNAVTLRTRTWHSNAQQAIEIARACNRLGYVVDVVDWQDTSFEVSKDYRLVLGIGSNFGQLSKQVGTGTVRVYYATGTYWEREIAAEANREEGLYRRRGVRIELPTRLRANDWVETADAVIVMGNETVARDYRLRNGRVWTVDNTALDLDPPDFSNMDFSSAAANFLWLGSAGLLHKGLDIALEAFSALPQLHLWVCGPIDSGMFGPEHQKSDNALVRAYRKELFCTPNIHPIGWLDVRSAAFAGLTRICGALVFPSCAEAMSGGVVTCMARGLIPIVSRETGLDTENFGITLETASVDELTSAVSRIAAVSPEQRRHMMETAWRRTTDRYSIAAFGRNYERILREILDDNGNDAC